MQAMLVATASALLSMLALPLTWVLAYVSGGAIALVTLKVGPKQGLQVAAGAVLGTALMALVVLRAPMLGITFALLVWLPVWLVGIVLQRTQSLSLALQAAVGIGVAAVVTAFAVGGDPAAAWMEMLTEVRPVLEELGAIPAGEEGTRLLQTAASMMTGGLAFIALVLTLAMSLFTGRAWQSGAEGGGAFQAEFRQLSFGRVMGYGTLALLAVALLTQQSLVDNITLVAVLSYIFVGLAVVHGALAGTGAGTAGLVGVYALLAFLPQLMGLLLALVGLADTWVDVRARLRRSPRA